MVQQEGDGFLSAMAVFALLSRPQEESPLRFSSEGLHGLKMTRDDTKKVFRMAFEANLFGSARTLVKLSPLEDDARGGEWLAVVSLPREISSVQSLVFHSKGEVRVEPAGSPLAHGGSIARQLNQQREMRLIMGAPRGGWEPPAWLREYLRGTQER